MKRLIMLVTAMLLACFALSAPAMATDEPAAEDETTTVVEPEVAPEPEPAAPVAEDPAPPVKEEVTPPAEEPKVEDKTTTTTPEEFEAYEVQACWTMDSTDGVEGTYQFPQTKGCGEPKCEETIEQQHDTYWIRDKEDEDYFANLNTLNSPADDARLEPHAYYSKVLTGDDCAPVVTKEKEQRTRTGEPDCEAGYSIVYYEERERTKTDDHGTITYGEWSEWKQVDNGTTPVTPEQCPTPPPPYEKWTYGTPDCDGELYPFTLPEDDEFYTYRVDDTGDDSRTLVFSVEVNETGEIIYTDQHTFTLPKGGCGTDTPDTTTDEDAVLPNTGGPSKTLGLLGLGLLFAGAGVVTAARRRTVQD